MTEYKDFGFLPESEGKLMKEGRWLDVVQPLLALGYLRADELSAIQANNEALILSATKQVCREAEAMGMRFSYFEEDGVARLDGMSLEALNMMLAVEAEFPLEYQPKLGEVSIWTRLLHFRLWLFGLYFQDRISLAWSNDSELALDQFADFFRCQRKKVFEFLADIHKVIDQMLDEPHFFHGIPKLSFVELPATLDGLPPNNKQKRFWNQLGADVGENLSAALREKFEDKQLDLQPFLQNPKNRFQLRVLRVFQWVKGYYRGDLGPAFHQKSMDSLNDLAKAENLDLRETMTFLRGNVWLFNISYLLRGIDDPNQGNEAQFKAMAEAAPSNFEELGALVEDMGEKPKSGFLSMATEDKGADADLQKAIAMEAQQKPEEIRKGYLDYVGGKSLLKTAGKWLRKFWDMLKDIWTKVKNAFKNIVGMIGRHIRRAYSTVADGLDLLFGKRMEATSGKVFSKMDFDFDTIIAIHPDANAADLQQHGEKLKSKSLAMSNTFFGFGKIINLIFLATSPAGWLKLGLSLIDEVKSAAKLLFRKQQSATA